VIRFDPATGQMIVSQDPAISVTSSPGIIYEQPAPAPAPRGYQPVPQPLGTQFQRQGIAPYDPAVAAAPAQAPVGNAQDVDGGRGLY